MLLAILIASPILWLPTTVKAQGGSGQPSAAIAALELEPCDLTMPGTPLTAVAECGTLAVPENPDEPDGRSILLNIARVPATNRSAEPDPLFLFAGGPGQAATESWLVVARSLRKLNETRDVILIDQRGTGKSNALRCPAPDPEDFLDSVELDWDELRRATRECLQGLDGDPRFYTTTIGMADYNQVRQALGYEQINLFGVSYGTRSAQVYLRMFPETVRAVVLDSIVPQTLALGSEHAQSLDQAVFKVLRACDRDSDCREIFPGTPALLTSLMRDLSAQPREVTVAHPLTGKPTTFTFNRDTLGFSLRFLAYNSDTQAMLPLLVHEAATDGNLQRLASMLLMVSASLQDVISSGMEMAVMCSEDYPLFPRIDLDSPEPEGSLMGNLMIKSTAVRCSEWPRGHRPEGFHQAVVSAKPALLLSGELDPVTPPAYGDEVARHMENSLHLVIPGQGHAVFSRGCVGKIITHFIENASTEGLETDCIEQLKYTPFFVGLTGPKP